MTLQLFVPDLLKTHMHSAHRQSEHKTEVRFEITDLVSEKSLFLTPTANFTARIRFGTAFILTLLGLYRL